MSEIIIVKNRPALDELFQTNKYKSVGSDSGTKILEDFTGARALCTVDDDRKLEYIQDYLRTNCQIFVDNLSEIFPLYWIEQNDLLEYNQYFMRPEISFTEFENRITTICKDMCVTPVSLVQAQSLWQRIKPVQKAKVLPYGYIKNYIKSTTGERIKTLNATGMLKDAIHDKLQFGIPTSR